MCRYFLFFRILSLVFLATLANVATARQPLERSQAAQALIAQAEKFGQARVIVRLNLATLPEGALNLAARAEQRARIRTIRQRLLTALRGYDVRSVRTFDALPLITLRLDTAALTALLANTDVASVYEDRLNAPILAESTEIVGAPAAWAEGFSGSGQVVAVLDTGVDSAHSFLAGKVIDEACFSSNFFPQGATSTCPDGSETQTGSSAAAPCQANGCDHGTHVAGSAAGSAIDFSGVARDADILAIQVFSAFSGRTCSQFGYPSPCVLSYTSDQISALEYVYDQRDRVNLAAVNLSLGGGRFTSACNDDPTAVAIDLLRSVDIATVAAAGNEGFSNAVGAPACVSSAISVGATTETDAVASFSNSAQLLDLLAPGVSIRSSVPGGGFAIFNGTSMATPHVAGALAVLRSAAPAATVDELLTALKNTGVVLVDPRNNLSKPRIQVDTAVAALADSITGGVLSVNPSVGFTANGAVGGPFMPASQAFTLTNAGPGSIDLVIDESTDWLTVEPRQATLAPGAAAAVTVTIDAAAATLAPGDYTGTVDMINATNGSGSLALTIRLAVSGTAAVNDDFEDAIELVDAAGVATGSNIGASKQSGEPNHAGQSGGRSVWWHFTATADGTAIIDTIGSDFDTLLGVYIGSDVAELTTVAGNDDAVGAQSRVDFETSAGVDYAIAVDGAVAGAITLNWRFTPSASTPGEISVTPETGLSAAGPEGGPFSPAAITYTLTNVGSATISFTLQDLPNWITASQTSGSLTPGSSSDVTLTLNATAAALAPGAYTATVLFNKIARPLTLQVSAAEAAATEFVQYLYEQFYGRAGDAAGVQFWAGAIENDSLSSAAVVEAFFFAPEFQAQVAPIARLYFAAFARIPDAEGFAFWVDGFRSGESLAQIAAAFVDSAEFQARFGTGLTDPEFIEQLYLNVLGRSADPDGLAFWLTELTAGASRGRVLASFSESAEHQDKTAAEIQVTLLYQGLLQRSPSATELQNDVELALSTLITELLMADDYTGPPAP